MSWLVETTQSSSLIAPLVVRFRIERVAQAVTEEAECEHRQEDADNRRDREVRIAPQELLPFRHHATPGGLRRPDADTDEGEERLTEDCLRDHKGRGDDQRRQTVR